MAQERQGIEIATKSMEDFKPQIFSKLKQHQEKLYEELSEQTSKINIDREKLQQDFNSFNVEMTEKEQQHHQEMLMLFKQLEEPLKEQQKKHNDLQENLNKVNHDLNNHWHRHANLKSNLKEYISTKPQFTPMPELCRVQ